MSTILVTLTLVVNAGKTITEGKRKEEYKNVGDNRRP